MNLVTNIYSHEPFNTLTFEIEIDVIDSEYWSPSFIPQTEPIIMTVFSVVTDALLISFTPIPGVVDGYRYGYRALPSGTFSYAPLSSSADEFFISNLESGALYEITLDTSQGQSYMEVDRIVARTS